MVQQIADGRLAIGYDIVGSYALEQAERNADLGMVVPRDYTLLMSRIAVIPAAARHPSAAGLFLDYLLSRAGQKHLVAEDMPSVRDDVTGPARLSADGIPLRAIRVGPALLVTQDQLTRQFFLRRWQTALDEGRGEGHR
jgi:iron(III) transport system substrate-binding protein